MIRHLKRRQRRGTSAVQWVLIAAVITLVVIASVQLVGRESNERLENTSGAVGDPSSLVDMID